MTDANSAERTPTRLDELAEAWLDTSVELHPELRVELGRDGDPAEYSDYSPEGLEAERAALRRVLAELETTPIADAVDEVTALELRRTLELDLERLDAELPLRDVNNIATPAHSIRMIFDLMPQTTEADWSAIADRLANVPAAIEGYLATLREGVAKGVVPARRQVAELATQTGEYAKQGGFFTQLAAAEGAELPASLRSGLAQGAQLAAEAFGRLSIALSRELQPAAAESDAVGRELYELNSRMFLGARVDLDETYEWGLEELARMRAEQESIAAEIAPGRTVAETAALLDEDARYLIGSAEEFRDWMQARSDEAVAALAGAHFDIPEPMRRLECRIAPTQEGIIYYTGPSDDFERPGRMWWSVPPGVERFSTWRELTTVFHEGVPGHHLQIATATAQKATLNSWRRVNWCSGHGEGWALYAERFMDELGYLDEPAYRFGMLDAQRMRAARVVLDLGVHLGKRVPGTDRVWDYDAALAFMTENVNMDSASVRFEVHRYLGWPGQAPSYKIGQRIWEELRDEARAREGEAFDLRAWHTRALTLGTVGLDTLRTALAA